MVAAGSGAASGHADGGGTGRRWRVGVSGGAATGVFALYACFAAASGAVFDPSFSLYSGGGGGAGGFGGRGAATSGGGAGSFTFSVSAAFRGCGGAGGAGGGGESCQLADVSLFWGGSGVYGVDAPGGVAAGGGIFWGGGGSGLVADSGVGRGGGAFVVGCQFF